MNYSKKLMLQKHIKIREAKSKFKVGIQGIKKKKKKILIFLI